MFKYETKLNNNWLEIQNNEPQMNTKTLYNHTFIYRKGTQQVTYNLDSNFHTELPANERTTSKEKKFLSSICIKILDPFT